jgi:3-hydroxybutyryl-CoA dehydrogenase
MPPGGSLTPFPPGAFLEGADVLVEALPEDLATKAAVWRALGPDLPAGLLCLTATSALPLRAIQEASGLAAPLLGFHPFVPVRRMRVVELASREGTPPEALARARELAARLSLRAVLVKDQPGFAASRMALCQGLEAMRLLEAGVASAEDLDALMVLGYGHPVGPLELSDRVGLDLRLKIALALFEATGERRFEPPAILRDLVARGWTGRRAGRGFHVWPRPGGDP